VRGFYLYFQACPFLRDDFAEYGRQNRPRLVNINLAQSGRKEEKAGEGKRSKEEKAGEGKRSKQEKAGQEKPAIKIITKIRSTFNCPVPFQFGVVLIHVLLRLLCAVVFVIKIFFLYFFSGGFFTYFSFFNLSISNFHFSSFWFLNFEFTSK
jgi:uncharacterized membrane protein